MNREQKKNREKNPPSYRSHHAPRAEGTAACPTDEKAGPPSSAAESRTKDEEGCTEKRPLVASKDQHEKSTG